MTNLPKETKTISSVVKTGDNIVVNHSYDMRPNWMKIVAVTTTKGGVLKFQDTYIKDALSNKVG